MIESISTDLLAELQLPMTVGKNVLKLMPAHQNPEACHVLSRSFRYDPLFCWTTPDDVIRISQQTERFQLSTSSKALLKLVVTDEKGFIKNVAVWVPPRAKDDEKVEKDVKEEKAADQALEKLRTLMGEEGWRKRAVIRGELEDLHNKVMKDHPIHWYLYLFVTDPAYQKQGVGKFALAPVLQSADRNGQYVYLETVKENIAYYTPFGFTLVANTEGKEGCPLAYALLRAPTKPTTK